MPSVRSDFVADTDLVSVQTSTQTGYFRLVLPRTRLFQDLRKREERVRTSLRENQVLRRFLASYHHSQDIRLLDD